MDPRDTRRAFIALAGGGTLAIACRNRKGKEAAAPRASTQPAEIELDVSATEDLMREHGVIRRVLVVYREAALRLRTKPASAPPEALYKAATLIRTFGEDYHEKQLEEAHLFPALKKAGGAGAAASDIDALVAQHQRGREITDYVLAVTQKAVGVGATEPLARTLEAFARMYEIHAAHEDTIVFPAWKKALSPKQLDEMGDLFEDIEHKTFGKDGFDDAVAQIAAIEKSLGIDLDSLTAPAAPKS
jgi:hemerythrin-like domain-containing protein